MLENLKITRLPNGIRIVTCENERAEGVRTAIHVRVGSRNEPLDVNGASHIIEHMLFKGTPKRNAREISQAIEGQGGSINAYTSYDQTCYYAVVPYDRARRAFDVLSDIYLNASFDPKEFERERKVILEEIRMYDDRPDSVVFTNLFRQLWSGHPIGRPIAGPAETVAGVSREAILQYRAQQYAPSRTVIAFGGRVKHDDCVKLVEKSMGHLKDSDGLRHPEPFSRIIPLEPISIVRRPIQQAHLAFGWRTPGIHERPYRAPISVLSNLLGGSMMSRLFQSIREKRGLCYSIYAGQEFMTDTGAFIVQAGCDPEKAYIGAKAIMKEIQKMTQTRVGAAELKRTVDYIVGRFRLRMDGQPVAWAAEQVLFDVDTPANELIEEYRSVTPEALLRIAQEIFRPDNMALSLVLPQDLRPADAVWQKFRTSL